MKENTLLLRRNSVQNLFNGYYYDSTIAAMAGAKMSQIYQFNNHEDKAEGKLDPKNVNTSEVTTKEITKEVTNK